MALMWRHGGGHGGGATQDTAGGGSGASSPANGGALDSYEGTRGERGTRGVWCLPRRRRSVTRSPTTRAKEAAAFGEVAARRSGGAPAKRRRAPGAHEYGDADGGGGEDAEAVMAVLEAAE